MLCVTPIFRFSPNAFKWLLNQQCFRIEESFRKAPLAAFLLELFAAAFLLLPIVGFMAPFVLKALPIQVYFGNGIVVKMMSSAVYGLSDCHREQRSSPSSPGI